jgi:hypothetical protein
VFYNDTVFFLHSRLGPFSAEQRAVVVSQRLELHRKSITSGADSLRVEEVEGHSEIVAGDAVLMTVLDADAAPLNLPRPQVAQEYAVGMRDVAVRVTLLVTRVRTIKNVDVTIPNGAVLASQGDQRQQPGGRPRSHPAHDDHHRVRRAVDADPPVADRRSEGNAGDSRGTSLDDFYVSYEVNAYTRNPAVMVRTYTALHQNIQDQFNRAGVEIMSPHYRSLRDGNQVTLPAPQLPKSYPAPAFRVTRVEPGGE